MASSKQVDGSLWWNSFVDLFEELDNSPLSSDLPESLVKKVKDNHQWFVHSVDGFKPQNALSKTALDSQIIAIGEHQLSIDDDFKQVALAISSSQNLDEVQSYILVHRCDELRKPVSQFTHAEILHLVLVNYFLERQCILKCIRFIFTRALYTGKGSHESNFFWDEALMIVCDGVEDKLLKIFEGLVSSAYCEKMEDVDVTTLWVEESLLEDNLILDILFLIYYDNFCTCNGQQWKKLCDIFMEILSGSLDIEKLAASADAGGSFYCVKVQLLLILIEALDLDNLLRKVYDQVSFRDGCSAFSVTDVQEIDVVMSNVTALETIEAGPLVLAWAVFLCLLQSLPDKNGCGIVLEIDHVEYVHKAMRIGPFNYLVEVLRCNLFKDSDAPISGFLSVLRTFISSFVSAYEIKYQFEDDILGVILEILCQIYRGEEGLCMQFWDRDSFVDGPIRSLLSMLGSEFPFRLVEFIRMLSSLCEGVWPAECVYNFLDNLSGITFAYKIPEAIHAADTYEIIETPQALHVPGIEGVLIPRRTQGQVLKVIDEHTMLVRWQHTESGVLLLLLRLAQDFHSINFDELDPILDLLYRLFYFNKALCFTMFDKDNSLIMRTVEGHMRTNTRIDVVKILSSLVSNLLYDSNNSRLVAMCINILGEMLNCLPSHVSEMTLETNFFGLYNFDSLSDVWFLSRGLERMLLADCEENAGCMLTISVLDYTARLIDVGNESSLVSSLIVFSVQYVLVNHGHWKYKLRSDRWKITLKVLEVIKTCIGMTEISAERGLVVRDILFGDFSVHEILFRIVCVTSRNLKNMHVSSFCEAREVEALQLTIASALDILFLMLMKISETENINPNELLFLQKVLSSNVKPAPIISSLASLMSFFHDPGIQLAAARVLSLLLLLAARVQAHSFENFSLVTNDTLFEDFVTSIITILDVDKNEDLVISVIDLLISAAHCQPSVFVNMILFGTDAELSANGTSRDSRQLEVIRAFGTLDNRGCLIGTVLYHVNRSAYLIESSPRLLLCILKFLKVLWEMGDQYVQILDIIRTELFWKHLACLISSNEVIKRPGIENLKCDTFSAYRYQCQSVILEIMAHDIFLGGKTSHVPSENQTSESVRKNRLTSGSNGASNILSQWCESSVLSSLVKFYSSNDYAAEIVYHAKMAISVCVVHLMVKISSGNSGSLSLSLVRRIRVISEKLTTQPAFSTLLTQYALHGYSKKGQLNILVLNDLYHHLLGELEGREISHGPFKELALYLLSLDIFQESSRNHAVCPRLLQDDEYMYNLKRLRKDLGITLWDHSKWNHSKPIIGWALNKIQEANLTMLGSDSKCSALKALSDLLAIYSGNIVDRKSGRAGKEITHTVLRSSIECLCKYLQDPGDSLKFSSKPVIPLSNFYVTQVELLSHLHRCLLCCDSVKSSGGELFVVCDLVIRTSVSALRYFSDSRESTILQRKAVELFLMLLLTSVEYINSIEKSIPEVDLITESSPLTLGLLPILCRYVEFPYYCNLSIASIDLILNGFLSHDTWLPVVKKHLKLQYIMGKLQESDCGSSIIVILKFLLTLARTKGGAKMLQDFNCFSSLKMVFNHLASEDDSVSLIKLGNDERPEQVWVLGLAVVTSMIRALHDDTSCNEIVNSAISYFLSEKEHMIHQRLPNFTSKDQYMKRISAGKAQTSLSSLREAEHTLMLLCELAKHTTSWITGVKGRESEIREMCIHMLAFISKVAQHSDDTMNNTALFSCPPILRNEAEANERPSFVGSKSGWFSLSAVGSMPKIKALAISNALVLINKDHANGKFSSMAAGKKKNLPKDLPPPSSSESESDEEPQVPQVTQKATTPSSSKAPIKQPLPPTSSSEEESDDETEEEEETSDTEVATKKEPPLTPKEQPLPNREASESESESETEEEKTPPRTAPADSRKRKSVTEKVQKPAPPAASPSGKKLFQRLWTDEDEVSLIKMLAEYKNKHGKLPSSAAENGAFHELVKGTLQTDFNSKQLLDKVRKLKQKYCSKLEKFKDGKKLGNEQEKLCFDLSRKVWGDVEPKKAKEEQDGGDKGGKGMTESGKTKKRKTKSATTEAVENGVKVDEDGVVRSEILTIALEEMAASYGNVSKMMLPELTEALGKLEASKVKEMENEMRDLSLRQAMLASKQHALWSKLLHATMEKLGYSFP